jgi:predicted nucleic acid-binding protein
LIVTDASLIVDALIGNSVALARLSSEELVAPALLDAEVCGTIRRLALRADLDERLAEAAVSDFLELELRRADQVPLIPRAWELRYTVSFADALYVALAEQLNAPLVTLDAELAGAPGIFATVEVVH